MIAHAALAAHLLQHTCPTNHVRVQFGVQVNDPPAATSSRVITREDSGLVNISLFVSDAEQGTSSATPLDSFISALPTKGE